jgi:uncharacterized protein (DUF697 family)
MASPLSLARVWRILKEVDLEAIRREAERQVHVLVIGETTADADELAVRLADGQADPTPWLTSIDASLGARTPAAGPGRAEAVLDGPDMVVAILRDGAQSAEMKAARQAWAARRVRLLTVTVGGSEETGTVRTQGDNARLAIDRLDDEGFLCVVDGLFAITDADRRVALARQFPTVRQKVFNALIEETARANAGYSFSTGLAEIVPLLDIPMNIGDMLVLTKNQLMMSYRIALAAGKTGQPRELIGEIVGVLGGGLLFRQLARQLVGLLPVIGLVPKVAVAYGGTWAIGRGAAAWATGGGRLTTARLRQLSEEGLARGRAVARSMRKGTRL